MREYRYTVAEHDPDRPWIVVGEIRQLTVQLEDGEDFHTWAARTWPDSRYAVDLAPWELSPRRQ